MHTFLAFLGIWLMLINKVDGTCEHTVDYIQAGRQFGEACPIRREAFCYERLAKIAKDFEDRPLLGEHKGPTPREMFWAGVAQSLKTEPAAETPNGDRWMGVEAYVNPPAVSEHNVD